MTTNYKHIQLKNGTLKYPADWILLPDAIVAPEVSSFAGVVECRNWEIYKIPHFVFFSNHRYAKDYTDDEITNIKKSCVAHWPEFAAVLTQQVEPPLTDPVYSHKWKQKLEEHLASPYIGYFSILSDDDPLATDNCDPFGCLIKRLNGGQHDE